MARPNNDRLHLHRLRDLYARELCLPSYDGIAGALGFRTKAAAFKLMDRLTASGHVNRVAGGRLAPGPNFFRFEFSDDEVRAGIDLDRAGSGLLQEQSLSELLGARPSRTILVRVRGESMVSAGILSGDVAVVETGAQAVNGDFVVAEIDGAHTIKEFRRTGGRDQLASHGTEPGVISPRQSLEIVGVVRGIVRTYAPKPKAATKLAKQGATR
ncbi:LexA family protein [Roseateles sp. LYH14W]|uniref:LexA family protein n=1 Tax=Pelomonas parva TaxID=3299032 RepID=A0ABW7EZI9_9BURK